MTKLTLNIGGTKFIVEAYNIKDKNRQTSYYARYYPTRLADDCLMTSDDELFYDTNPEFFQYVLDWYYYGHKTPGYVPEDLSPSAMARLKATFKYWKIPYKFGQQSLEQYINNTKVNVHSFVDSPTGYY